MVGVFFLTSDSCSYIHGTRRKENGYEIHWELYLDHGNNTACHYNCFNGKFNMSDIFPDLEKRPPKQLEFDFNKKELEPIPFGERPPTFIDIFDLGKFTELLEGNKKD